MKKMFIWLSEKFKWISAVIPLYLSLSLLVSVIVALITWNIVYGFFTLFEIAVFLTIFAMARQLWWWVRSTGDYENKDM